MLKKINTKILDRFGGQQGYGLCHIIENHEAEFNQLGFKDLL